MAAQDAPRRTAPGCVAGSLCTLLWLKRRYPIADRTREHLSAKARNSEAT